MEKWILSLTSAFILPFYLYAEMIQGDDCNNSSADICHWEFDDETGILTISGNGYMKGCGYGESVNKSPWAAFANSINSVVIHDGIKYIGGAAFAYTSLSQISIPDSVVGIGYAAFYETPNLSEVNLPKSINALGYDVFQNSSVVALVLPESLLLSGKLDSKSLKNSNISTIYCPSNTQKECEDYIASAKENGALQNLHNEFYYKWGTQYLYKGRFYRNFKDIVDKNYINKRIYTLDEANRVAGSINHISIRYR